MRKEQNQKEKKKTVSNQSKQRRKAEIGEQKTKRKKEKRQANLPYIRLEPTKSCKNKRQRGKREKRRKK
jgi:hypothetical protein